MLQPVARDAYQESLEFLYGRIDYERTSSLPARLQGFRLGRMRQLLNLLGNPQHQLRIVHIAGTKGKGSTAAMVAQILQQSGFRTGLFTSPHLERLEERLAIDGRPCNDHQLVRLTEQVRPAVDALDRQPDSTGRGPTYFEITTAMALLHFAQQGTAACVLEVGLGGRLDSTNVCQPAISVITSISFDHMRQLGSTLAQIAGEKAGIIKPRVPVISGVTPEEPRDVIRRVAAEHDSPLYELGRDFLLQEVDGPVNAFSYLEPAWDVSLERLQVGLLGRHQLRNAAIAVATVRRLVDAGWTIDAAAIRDGLALAHCPARLERVAQSPDILVDVAHNVASIQALVETVQTLHPERRKLAIFASSSDKNVDGMLDLLLPVFDEVILTRFVKNPRALAVDALHQLAVRNRARLPAGQQPILHTAGDPESAWQLARGLLRPDDVLYVAGSFFLAAELRGTILRDCQTNKPPAAS